MRKIVIFDFDGTLYNGENVWGKEWLLYCFNALQKAMAHLPEDERQRFVKQHNLQSAEEMHKHNQDSSDIYKLMEAMHYGEEWKRMSREEFFHFNIQNVTAVISEKVLQEFHKVATLYIVTNSSIQSVKYHSEQLGINLKYFKDIYENRYDDLGYTKAVCVKDIMRIEKVKPSQVYVFGDNINTDVLQMQMLGVNAFHCPKISDIKISKIQ